MIKIAIFLFLLVGLLMTTISTIKSLRKLPQRQDGQRLENSRPATGLLAGPGVAFDYIIISLLRGRPLDMDRARDTLIDTIWVLAILAVFLIAITMPR